MHGPDDVSDSRVVIIIRSLSAAYHEKIELIKRVPPAELRWRGVVALAMISRYKVGFLCQECHQYLITKGGSSTVEFGGQSRVNCIESLQNEAFGLELNLNLSK